MDGLIDDVDLEQLLMDRIRLDTQETLTSSTSFEGLKVEGLEADCSSAHTNEHWNFHNS